MSKTGQYLQELMAAEKYQEEGRPRQEEPSPSDWAQSQEEWHPTLGRCLELMYQAIEEQDGLSTDTFAFFHRVWWFAIMVIAYKHPLNMDTAYRALGYPQREEKKEEEEYDDLPF